LVLALASDAVLARFNALAYGRQAHNPHSSAFKYKLFSWEEEVVATYFPRPPARLLVGGAGAGREVLALAARGYEIVSFEPSEPLAALMADRVTKGLKVRVYRAGYEDLPRLFPVSPGGRCTNLEAESGFDAAILGFGSYSHLRTKEQRIHTLSSFARYVHGPILVSFHQSETNDIPLKARTTGRLGGLLRIGTGERFSVYIGFTHDVVASELAAVAVRSGLSIVHLNEHIGDPHAVLRPIKRDCGCRPHTC
jgi:hypothetical protein